MIIGEENPGPGNGGVQNENEPTNGNKSQLDNVDKPEVRDLTLDSAGR